MSDKIVVYHASYGCDTGCCGHIVEVGGKTNFHFDHPYGDDFREFAEYLVRDQGCDPADLDWDNCLIIDD